MEATQINKLVQSQRHFFLTGTTPVSYTHLSAHLNKGCSFFLRKLYGYLYLCQKHGRFRLQIQEFQKTCLLYTSCNSSM